MAIKLARPSFNRLGVGGNADLNFQALQRFEQGQFVPVPLTATRSPYQVQGTDDLVLVDASAGPVTLVFYPASQVDGVRYEVVKTDSTTNAVTLQGTIGGVVNPTLTLPQSSLTIRAGNGVYYVTDSNAGNGARYRVTTDGSFRVTTTGAFRITTPVMSL